MVHLLTLMEASTLENGRRGYNMVMGPAPGQTEKNMSENGRKGSYMDKE